MPPIDPPEATPTHTTLRRHRRSQWRGCDRFQCGPHLSRVVVALSRFFGQTPLNDASQYWRNARWQWCGRFLQNRRRKLHGRRAGEGQCAGRHLVQNDPKCPDVRARIGRFANDDFGRHVTGCAHHHTGLRESLLRLRPSIFVAVLVSSDAEIQDLHATLRHDDDVRALEVAVHDAVLVRVAYRIGDLNAVADQRFERKPVPRNHR